MAVTRQKRKKVFLGEVLKSNLNNFKEQRDLLRADEESRFWRKATDEGMGYEEQLEYRNDQLEREEGRRVTDKNFVKEIKDEIVNLKKLKREKDYQDSYRRSVEDLNLRRINISQHINFLQDSLENTTDQSLKEEIKTSLQTAKIDRQEIKENVITNRATYAENTKSKKLLQDSISEVQKERNKALLSGNDELVTKWESKLFSLNNTLNVEKIQDSFDVLKTRQLTEDLKSTDLLEFYTDNVAKAGNESVLINGTRYDTMKDFWNENLSGYINDKFFQLYESEVGSKLERASKQLTPMMQTQIEQVNKDLDYIQSLPQMEPFVNNIEQTRNKINFDAVTQLNNKILKDYSNQKLGETATKNYENAINKLKGLNQKYNVDVSGAIEQINSDIFAKKQSVAQNIEKLATVYMENEGLGYEEAINKAEKFTPALDIPISEGAGMSPADIIRNVAKESQGDEKRSRFDISTEIKTPEEPRRTEPEQPEQPERATLINQEGRKEVVDVGSQRASDLQSQGFSLMGAEKEKAPAPQEETQPKKATLFGPQGEKQVVDVGSQQASELQSRGFKLEEQDNINKQ